MLRKIAVICLAFILALAILPRFTLAQSTAYLESRVSRIEGENAQLRSQISRLETQVDRLLNRSDFPRPQPNTLPTPTPSPSPTPRRANSRQTISTDPMFQRLANLLIELKERVNTLEAEVAQLKRQRR